MEKIVGSCGIMMTDDTKVIPDSATFNKKPVPLSKSPGTSPSIRSMTQTVIVSLAETVTHDITYGKFCCPTNSYFARFSYENKYADVVIYVWGIRGRIFERPFACLVKNIKGKWFVKYAMTQII